MKPTIQATRSVAAEFANRLFLPVLLIGGIGSVVFLAGSIYLVTLSAWWVILLVLVSIIVVFLAGVLTISWFFIRMVSPDQNKTQKKMTKEFVDKLQRVAEVAATPKFVLFFQVMRDVVNPRQDGFIITASSDASSLKSDFSNLRDSFTS